VFIVVLRAVSGVGIKPVEKDKVRRGDFFRVSTISTVGSSSENQRPKIEPDVGRAVIQAIVGRVRSL
jgi:hypothetical protein